MKYVLCLVILAASTTAWSYTPRGPRYPGGYNPPTNTLNCPTENGNLPINDPEIIQYIHTTPNQFLARAHIKGLVTRLYPFENGHVHFEAAIGPDPQDRIEMVYDIAFGPIPTPTPGMEIEACGDYITSDEATNQYPASPDGAIIHWIHMSPNPNAHPSGFLVLNNTLYGQHRPNNDE